MALSPHFYEGRENERIDREIARIALNLPETVFISSVISVDSSSIDVYTRQKGQTTYKKRTITWEQFSKARQEFFK